MIWIILMVMFLLISLFHWSTYQRARQKWQAMVTVDGELLDFQLNPKTKKIKPADFHQNSGDLEIINNQATLKYTYEFNDQTHHSMRLCLLGEVNAEVLDNYLAPKPMNIQVRVNPHDPKDAALELGRLSLTDFISYYAAAAILVFAGFRFFG